MSDEDKTTIRRWMKKNREDHVDEKTGKINREAFVEECVLFGPECCDVRWLYDKYADIWDIVREFE